MFVKRFSGPGSTPARRRFWDQVAAAVNASRKVAGRNITVNEHPGSGSVISIDEATRQRPGTSPPPVPCSVSLLCDSISASRTKCGFEDGPYSGDASCFRYFLTRTETVSGGSSHSITGCTPCSDTIDGTIAISTYTVNSDGTCTFNSTPYDVGEICCGSPPDCSPSGDGCFCCGNTFTTEGDSGDPAILIEYGWCDVGGGCNHGTGENCELCRTRTVTDTDEYTTEALCENAVAALPDFSGSYGSCDGSDVSHHTLDSLHIVDDVTHTECASTCSVKETNYKFTLGEAIGATACITWDEVFYPQDGSSSSTTNKSTTIGAGDTESEVITALVPDGFGTVNIENVSCVEC